MVGGQLLTLTPPLGPQRSHSASDGGDEGWGQAADGPFSNAPRIEYLRSISTITDSMANKSIIRFSIIECCERSFWGVRNMPKSEQEFMRTHISYSV